jgi:tyrosyl-tRNA synthetase
MLLQAYDFVHLNKEHGCLLQIGASDQWGNITAGIDLARRMHGVQLYGLTCPLLTKSDGSKMGKTESGTVWLSPKRTSPYAFYQYLINVDDADAGKCLRMLTELSHEEIAELDRRREEQPEKRESQRKLAEDLTEMVHGVDGLLAAVRASAIFFSGVEIKYVTADQLNEIFADVPSREVSIEKLSDPGLSIVDAFVDTGLAKSKGEARRIVEQGGAYLNNRRVDSFDRCIKSQDIVCDASMVVLRSGRKKYAVIRFVG